MTQERLRRCRDLVHACAGVPMDHADATLVAIAEESGIGDIYSLDRRGFETCRWRRFRRFPIKP